MINPYIREVCDHYPEPAIGQAPRRDGVPVTCACADCFYCDNDGREGRASA